MSEYQDSIDKNRRYWLPKIQAAYERLLPYREAKAKRLKEYCEKEIPRIYGDKERGDE